MNIHSIKQKIEEDKARSTSSYRRYPVRFLFMEMNSNTQDEVAELVRYTDGELLDLSDYIMKKSDGWMTKNHFLQIVKKNASKTKDTYVLGFSELIRFFSKKEIEATVLSLFDIENDNIMDAKCSQRRIYFICFSMVDNVCKVLQNSFSRISLLDPFINPDYEISGKYREVCFVSKEYVDRVKNNIISTSVDWLGLWRHSQMLDFSLPIWCCSESLFEWHKKASPDNAFQIDVVTNAKEYIWKAYGMKIEFNYENSEDSNWNTLCLKIQNCKATTSLQVLLSELLSINVYEINSLAGKFISSTDDFEKWLIKNYALSYLPNTFLCKTFSTICSSTNKEFITRIWQLGYSISQESLLNERKAIIDELSKYATAIPPEHEISCSIWNGIKDATKFDFIVGENTSEMHLLEWSELAGCELSEVSKRLKKYYQDVFKPAYTGKSRIEKEFIISFYSNRIIGRDEIEETYPSLYSYLFANGEDYIPEKADLKYYLQAYRESKVFEADSPYIEQYYSNGCANAANLYSLYYSLQKQEALINPYIADTDIYILDGVGAEYMPLIIKLIEDNKYEIEFCDYSVCHLPSITDVNKKYLASIPYKEWFLDFDRNVIHGEYYKTSLNLRKSFDILEEKIKDILVESNGKRILISADHGATARPRWVSSTKKYAFTDADHEGRCCRVPENTYVDTEDYIYYEDEITPENRYVISLNAQSLNNRPKYEGHGGATIEEMLVPIIVAIPEGTIKKIIYKVIGEKLEVSGLDKTISFMISPTPDVKAVVIESDGSTHTLEQNNSLFSAKLNSGKEQSIKVVISNKEYSFSTISRAKKNMEGDDGFDD